MRSGDALSATPAIRRMKRAPAALCMAAAAALCACNGSDSLQPPAPVGITATNPSLGPTAPVTSTAGATPISPAQIVDPAAPAPQGAVVPVAIATSTSIQLAPITGASTEAVNPLTQAIANRARQRGINVQGAGSAGATHMLKGYFSTDSEGAQTTVYYVWDVVDQTGTRLHRIQGQMSAASAGGAGWSAVSAQTMQAIGDDTVDQLATWLAARPG